MVEQYFKYDSGAKEFRGLSARDFGATTDAVALHPLQHAGERLAVAKRSTAKA